MNVESFRRIRAALADRLLSRTNTERRSWVEDIRRLAIKRKITYEYDKASGEEPIRILFPPVFIPAEAVSPLRDICLRMAIVCEKALAVFLERPEVRKILPLDYDEEVFLFSVNPKRHADRPAIWQRLDAALDPNSPVDTLRFMETNMNSVGGVYYAPAVEKLAMENVLSKFLDKDHLAQICPNEDIERMLLDRLSDHASRLGLRGAGEDPAIRLRIAVVENDPDAAGCTESSAVCEGLSALGADAFLARPDEFEIRGSHILHSGGDSARVAVVDLIYRFFEIREMKEMGPTKALETAFAQHRVVSSLGGDLDHKSLFELFTSTAYDRLFSSDDRRLFRKHVLWTRLLRETFTDAPDGSKIDLPEFAYHSRETLVLKPNRSYGGEGILIGRQTEEREWQKAIEAAMSGRIGVGDAASAGVSDAGQPGFVVQSFYPLTQIPFSVIDPAGDVTEEPLHVVFGFSASASGLGVIGRASRSSVVNVARHGGLVPVFRLS